MPRGDHGPGADLGPALDDRAVQHPGPDPDESAVLDRAAVDDRLVPDHHPFADHQRVMQVGDVEHGAVLDVRPRADADEVDVPPGHGVEPEGDVVPQHHVARDVGVGRQEDAGA